ncbi:MAG: pilus assembly protein TadG-related protein [Dehalococcoidia bacterium]
MLVLTAAALLVLCGFSALALDVGRLYLTRGELQNGADASALAGGQSLAKDQATAEAAARDWAERNDLEADEVVSIDFDVNCSGESKENAIRVEVKREVTFAFARVLGINESDVVACSTVQIGSPGWMSGVIPFGVEEDSINFGGSTTLKTDSSNKAGSNTGLLALGGRGASNYRDNLKYGYDEEICASEWSGESCMTETEPGNKIGPTREGMEYRLGNTSAACDTFNEVFVQRDDDKYGFRGDAGCNPFQGSVNSLRVVVIPVIAELPGNGRKDVEILRFAVFFLEDLDSCTGNDCTVTGRFVDFMGDVGGKLGTKGDGMVFVRIVG